MFTSLVSIIKKRGGGGGGGGGGLTGPQLLEGVAGKEGVTFFWGGCNCHITCKNIFLS